MKQRLLTAGFLAILYVGLIAPALLINPIFYDILVLIFMFTASYEMVRVIQHKFPRPIEPLVYVQVVIAYVSFRVANYFGQGNWGISACFGSLLIMVVIGFVYNMFSKKFTMANILSTLFVMIYPLSLLSYLLAINYVGDVYRGSGIMFAFAVTSLVDSMALLVGSVVKGPKLIPSVSPNKTISGAIGGLIGGVVGGLVIYILGVNILKFVMLFDIKQ